MSERRTELVDVFPLDDFKVALAFVKREKVGKRTLALAAENILSYTASSLLAEDDVPPLVMTSAHAPQEPADCEFALNKIISAGEGKGMKGLIDRDTLKTILKTLLPFILSLL